MCCESIGMNWLNMRDYPCFAKTTIVPHVCAPSPCPVPPALHGHLTFHPILPAFLWTGATFLLLLRPFYHPRNLTPCGP